MSLPPLILTLKLDHASFVTFDTLRRQHFPPERNFIPAHITLFHALPGASEQSIQTRLHQVCSQTPILEITFSDVRFMGQGVGFTVECPALLALRQQLATSWQEWLSAQDRQGYRPHITIQNKVPAEQARHLFAHLSQEWKPLQGKGAGLLLWRYLGGPWELVHEFAFRS